MSFQNLTCRYDHNQFFSGTQLGHHDCSVPLSKLLLGLCLCRILLSGAPAAQQLLVDDGKADQMHREGQRPAYGIRDVQTVQRPHLPKYGVYPDHPEQAGARQGHQHRHDGTADAPQNPHDDIHHTAQEVGHADVAHTQNAIGNHLGVRGIEL